MQSWRKGIGYLSGVVTVFNHRKLPHGRSPPSFLPTMWRGEAQGEQDHLMIPSSSMEANSSLATASLAGLRRLALAYTGGPVDGMCSCTLWLGCLAEKVSVVRAGLPCSRWRKGHPETTATWS